MKKGFTLVEVLVSVLIMATIIIAIVTVEVNYLKLGSHTKAVMQANNLAEQAFSKIRTVRDSDGEKLTKFKPAGDPAQYEVNPAMNDFTSCSSATNTCTITINGTKYTTHITFEK
jgi:prepilin-type N-terminal cleavage/methylation domain-containing protein